MGKLAYLTRWGHRMVTKAHGALERVDGTRLWEKSHFLGSTNNNFYPETLTPGLVASGRWAGWGGGAGRATSGVQHGDTCVGSLVQGCLSFNFLSSYRAKWIK